jgi:hypothetical protein
MASQGFSDAPLTKQQAVSAGFTDAPLDAPESPGVLGYVGQVLKGAYENSPLPLLKHAYDLASTPGPDGSPRSPTQVAAQMSVDLVKGAVGAQAEQFSKAKQAYGQGRLSEAVGHAAAGVLPVVGPIAQTSAKTSARAICADRARGWRRADARATEATTARGAEGRRAVGSGREVARDQSGAGFSE